MVHGFSIIETLGAFPSENRVHASTAYFNPGTAISIRLTDLIAVC